MAAICWKLGEEKLGMLIGVVGVYSVEEAGAIVIEGGRSVVHSSNINRVGLSSIIRCHNNHQPNNNNNRDHSTHPHNRSPPHTLPYHQSMSNTK